MGYRSHFVPIPSRRAERLGQATRGPRIPRSTALAYHIAPSEHAFRGGACKSHSGCRRSMLLAANQFTKLSARRAYHSRRTQLAKHAGRGARHPRRPQVACSLSAEHADTLHAAKAIRGVHAEHSARGARCAPNSLREALVAHGARCSRITQRAEHAALRASNSRSPQLAEHTACEARCSRRTDSAAHETRGACKSRRTLLWYTNAGTRTTKLAEHASRDARSARAQLPDEAIRAARRSRSTPLAQHAACGVRSSRNKQRAKHVTRRAHS